MEAKPTTESVSEQQQPKPSESSNSEAPSDEGATEEERLKKRPVQEASKMLNAQFLGKSRAQSMKIYSQEKDKQELITSADLHVRATLYIKRCTNSTYIVDTECTKVLIEGCNGCVIILRKDIKTEILEVWRCTSCIVVIDTTVKTLQLDLCKSVELRFSNEKNLGAIIWAGAYDLNITFLNNEALNFVTGYTQMKEKYPSINDTIDQFIIRFIEGQLKTEQIIRLTNGYPTTQREADAFEAEQQKNKKLAEEYLSKIVAVCIPSTSPLFFN
jgi:hypothetical protein